MSLSYENIYIYSNGEWISPYRDLDGNPVKRTKEQYHYSYDPFVVWKGDYDSNKGRTLYSDRLYQWDYKKYNECCINVWGDESQFFNQRNAGDIEKFLCLYFDKQVKLTVIMECCNKSSGYPYWMFIYEDVEV